MLTYESLIEQAKLREMPATKPRGILREYLQILILKEIYKTKEGKGLYFTGGTCLRLLANLKRFSEDLDFDTNDLTKKAFIELFEKVKIELERIGLECSFQFEFWNNVYSSKLLFPSIEKLYLIRSTYSRKQGIVIKLKANKLKYKINAEPNIISGFGEFFPILCSDKSIIFANKIDALIKKERAKHIYDFIFILSNKYPMDKKLLTMLGIKSDPLEVALKKVKSFTRAELKKKAESLSPFLFDESEADKITNARDLIPLLIDKYRNG